MADITRTDRKLAYKGAILDVYKDTMSFSNGNTEEWDYVMHRKGGAAVIPVLSDGRILLVRQFRNALDRETLEIPAGAREYEGEPSFDCAVRELEEETGYKPEKVEYLYTIATTVAFCNECFDIYAATELKPGIKNPDANEFINVEAYELKELVDMILCGKIQDSKTVGAILCYKEKYKK